MIRRRGASRILDRIGVGIARLRVKPPHENAVAEIANEVDGTANVQPADAPDYPVQPEGLLVGPFESPVQLGGGRLRGREDDMHGVVVVPVLAQDAIFSLQPSKQLRARVRSVKRVARNIDPQILDQLDGGLEDARIVMVEAEDKAALDADAAPLQGSN